jgi:malate dehydrogenase (oxaloacetate-decarboxylating)(NADP+)
LGRKGYLRRDCQRMVNQNRNIFAACMVACGEADAMVTGLTRSFNVAYEDIRRALDPKPRRRVFGLSVMVLPNRSVFLADTSVHELPGPEILADIAMQSAEEARAMGHEPRVALLSYSNFGNPSHEGAQRIRKAVEILDTRKVYFEYDGEMQASVALNFTLMNELYPFCRLSGPANVLVMPGLHSANITAKLIQQIGAGTVIGPLLIGLNKPAQVVQLGATVNDLVIAAAIAAYEASQQNSLL